MIMDIKNLLISKAKEIGVKVSPAQAEQFQIYLDLLLERNTVMNLTAITDPEEAVIKHFVDSLTLLKALEIKKKAKVIDVGTGAGFPGIPLKIMRPDIELTLLDSLNKRLVFLREVCRKHEYFGGILHSAHQNEGLFCRDERSELAG